MSQPGESSPFTFAYDPNSRLTEETSPRGTSVSYAYDAASNVTGLTYGTSTATYSAAFAYDSASRLTALTEPSGSTIAFNYGANDRLSSAALPGGLTKSLSYDHRRRDRLGARVAIGVGGVIDVLSGRKRRAPEVWRRLGLEWLYYLLREPTRCRRQLALPYFLLRVLWARFTGLRGAAASR